MTPTTYVAIDLETTGLNPDADEIIEVGIVTFRNGSVTDEWSSLVNPARTVPAFITSLTGITQEMVEESPSIRSLRAKISRLLSDNTLVGHNIGFDLEFLYSQNLALANRRLDTLPLASILLPGAGRFGLASLATRFELPSAQGAQEHRALYDARRTVDLFHLLQGQARDLDIAILEEIVRAGRHAGWHEAKFFEDVLRTMSRQAFGQGGRPPPVISGAKIVPSPTEFRRRA